MQTGFVLVSAGPAAVAPGAGLSARRAADRGVALVVKWVVGQVAVGDALPEVLLGPARERVVLVDAALLVLLDELRAGAVVRLLAPDSGDPALCALERLLER